MDKKTKSKPRGRPSVGVEIITFRLDSELYERIKVFSEKEQRPISNSIRLLLEVGLDVRSKKKT